MTALLHPVTILLAVLCIQWIDMALVGPFSVKPPYAAIAALILYTLVSPRRLAASWMFLRQNAVWIVPFAFYLLILAAALYGSKGQTIPARQMFYVLGAIALGASLATTEHLRPILRLGSALGILLFVLVVEVLARRVGTGWIEAVTALVERGDLKFVTYEFFRPVFNALNPDEELTVVASNTNSVGVCVVVLALLFRASGKARDFAGVAFVAGALFLVLLLGARSAMLIGLLGVVLAMIIRTLSRRAQSVAALAGQGIAFLVVAAALSYFWSTQPALSGAISERYAFQDSSAMSRLELAREAISRIADHPLLGSGWYEFNGAPVHNLFLGAWMHAGLAAFLLVTMFYVSLLGRWIVTVVSHVRHPDRWLLPVRFEWIAPLPLLLLFRVWLSGGAGHPFTAEWVAVGAFFGLVLANELMLRRQAGSAFHATRGSASRLTGASAIAR